MREISSASVPQQKPHVVAAVIWFLVMAIVAFGVTKLLRAYVADAQEGILSTETLTTNQQVSVPETPVAHKESVPASQPMDIESSEHGSVPYHEQPMSKQEIADVLRQIKELRAQIKQIERSVKKAGNAAVTSSMNELLSKLAIHEKAIKNPTEDMTQREAASAFWDDRLWDEVNTIRRMVDLPREMKDIERVLLRAEKTLKKPRVQKVLAEYISYGEESLKKVRLSYDAAKIAFAASDFEAAEDSMRDARDDAYPGEVEGTYEMLSGLMDSIRRIKDTAMREMFLEILQPVFDAIKESDFREARQALDDVNNQMYPLIDQAMRAPKKPSKAFNSKMQQLENLLQQKYSSDSDKDNDNKIDP